MQICDVPGKGRGVFAIKRFLKGEHVCDYEGELLVGIEGDARACAYDANTRDGDVCTAGCYMFWFRHNGKDMCIDAGVEDGSLGRLINHSKRNQNILPRKHVSRPVIEFVALRDILPGEELLYDYGEDDPQILAKFSWLAE